MSSDETPAFTYKLVTPGNILAVPRKVLMQESLDTERKPSNTVSVSIKYSNWEAASASMGFTTTVDDEGKDIETASNQMVLFGAIGSNTAPGTLSQKDRSLVFGVLQHRTSFRAMTKVKDSAMHFLSANSFCQFIKDNASATSALSVDDDELVALREVISAHRSSRKRSAEDALDEKPKASIGDHTEEDGQAKDNSPFSPKRACASAAEQEE